MMSFLGCSWLFYFSLFDPHILFLPVFHFVVIMSLQDSAGNQS